MTNSNNTPETTGLAVAVAPVRHRHRELIEAAVAWLNARDRSVDPDHLALICAGAEHAGRCADEPEPTPTRWTRLGTYRVLRSVIPNWCSGQRCLWPEQLPQTMWAWFDALHGLGRLDPASDPVAELRKPLACYGWLDQDGNQLPANAERQLPCECLLPFRETVELLDELVRQCERVGEDPLDRLRWLVGRAPRLPLADDRLAWLLGAPIGVDDALDLDDPLDPLDPLDPDDPGGWPGLGGGR